MQLLDEMYGFGQDVRLLEEIGAAAAEKTHSWLLWTGNVRLLWIRDVRLL